MSDKNTLFSYFDAHRDEIHRDLAELAAIPAPSHHEEQRVEWVMSFLKRCGLVGQVDAAQNVVVTMGKAAGASMYIAHTDVVFPDTTPLPVHIQDGRLCAPGAGDDTANLIVLLWVMKFLTEQKAVPKSGVVFAANSCEEGLGNLKGARQLLKDHPDIRDFVTFDGGFGQLVNTAVGSQRYRVTIRTEGGHSYGNFGNKNAIVEMSGLIAALYGIHVPPYGHTTYNVGGIEGGTSVNTIAQECRMLYEFRSDDRRGLAFMEKAFLSLCQAWRERGIEVEVETIGVRPCNGELDAAAMEALFAKVDRFQYAVTGVHCAASSGSTDANIPLALGIPALCTGVCTGHGAHTREEWIELASLRDGFAFAGMLIGNDFNF